MEYAPGLTCIRTETFLELLLCVATVLGLEIKQLKKNFKTKTSALVEFMF